MQKLPRQLYSSCPQPFADFDIDQDTVSAELFDTLPSSSSLSSSAELDPNGSLFDSEIPIPPDGLTYSLIPILPRQSSSRCPQLFADFDIDQDTVSTELFNTLPSSSFVSRWASSLYDPEPPIPPEELTYSLIPFREVWGDIGQGPSLARILRQEQTERTRFFSVPTRKCDPGTRPFCTTPRFVTQESPNRFSLESAYDRMSHSSFPQFSFFVFLFFFSLSLRSIW